MDIVKWLREFKLSTSDSNYNALIVNAKTEEAADEIERLRQQYAELLVEMERIADVSERWEDCLVSQINEIARAAIAKATGGE